MKTGKILPASFYDREVIEVARDLLGMRLVRWQDGIRISGIISEAEAYRGEEDLACHARVGKTKRTEVMYGPPGHAYIYFTYGMHWCLNCVAGAEDFPAAVLLRAIEPIEGLEVIAERRQGVDRRLWCNGPAKITKSMGLTGAQNGVDLTSKDGELWIEQGEGIPSEKKKAGPRVGMGSTPEPWFSMPWNFRILEN
jgi:DNA-3-methyladenine glycosylase